MNLAASIRLFSYGTSEGVRKAWDTRGRGRHTVATARAIHSYITAGGKVRAKAFQDAARKLEALNPDARLITNRRLTSVSVVPNSNDWGEYDTSTGRMKLDATADHRIVLHELAHHLESAWLYPDSSVKRAGEHFEVDPVKVRELREAINNEYARNKTRTSQEADIDEVTMARDWKKVDGLSRLRAVSGYAFYDKFEWFAETFMKYASSGYSRQGAEHVAPKTCAAIRSLLQGEIFK